MSEQCEQWGDYEKCRMGNQEAIEFLDHVKGCQRCSRRRERLQRQRRRDLGRLLYRVLLEVRDRRRTIRLWEAALHGAGSPRGVIG